MKNLWPVQMLSVLTLSAWSPAPVPAQTAPQAEAPRLLIRCDDFGMCHAVNMAVQQVIAAGIPVSVSVMFACPWYQEAVEILKAHPEVSVGVHLTLNAEWKNYRWGPVAGRSQVPSLVDREGFFFPSRALLMANRPKDSEVEKELRAQVERALRTGLRIDYLDHHMGTAMQTEKWRRMVEKLAQKHQLGIPQYFDEAYSSATYAAPQAGKVDSLVAHLQKLDRQRVNLQVMHVGLDTPEMAALIDLNAFGLANMSQHRQAELAALLSPQFRAAVEQHGVRLMTYRDLIAAEGLAKMRRPGLTQ